MLVRFTLLCCLMQTVFLQQLAGEEARESNKLFDVLMLRQARSGEVFGDNETAPIIFKFSHFPFDDSTYPRLTEALDTFTPQSIRGQTPVQRAILQRQLWSVFDATAPSRVLRRRQHESRRNASQPSLANLMNQLALTKAEIEALPDTFQTTVASGKFPTTLDTAAASQPFLPADLGAESSSWICFGRSSSAVTFHAIDSRWRSAFFQFIRLPNGRDATLKYIDEWTKDNVFPVGTQVALVEKAYLVSKNGELVLSPLTISIQLRTYRDVKQSFRDAEEPTQIVGEFISRPRDYLQGNSAMVAITPADFRLKTVKGDGGKQDVIELVSNPKRSAIPRLQQCMTCHGGAGVNSLGDVVVPRGRLKALQRRSVHEITEATAAAKREDNSWKLLMATWIKSDTD